MNRVKLYRMYVCACGCTVMSFKLSFTISVTVFWTIGVTSKSNLIGLVE